MLIDRQYLERYQNRELVVRLVDLFLEDVPRMIHLLHEALDAGALRTAARCAHTLRGCASNLGARALEERARVVERLVRAGDTSRARTVAHELDQLVTDTSTELCDVRRYCSTTHDAPLYVSVMR
jgi:HPt (histidine-containing phosphotransfer) domain-containing protein